MPIEHGMLLAAILFVIGLVGLLTRRNFLFMLISLEIMLNATGLAFIVGGSHWQQPDGQTMFIFILALAAAEVSIGLGLLLQLRHWAPSLDINAANSMRG